MTRLSQKQRERFFVEQAVQSLGTNWAILQECDPPDFIIASGDNRFGLDVSQVFMGSQSDSGSAMKKQESEMQRLLNTLRLNYEQATGGVLLQAKFVGSVTPETTIDVVPALVALDLASKQVSYQTVLDLGLGLKIFVAKAFRPDWYTVNHRVGWVDRNPEKIIANAIEAKAKKLPEYRAVAGSDIRLLLVADAIHNSGKMRLQEGRAFDFHGFEAVYFFPYPEKLIVLDKT